MAEFAVQIEGVQRLQQRLKDIGADVAGSTKAALQVAGEVIRTAAVKKAPKKMGNLRANIVALADENEVQIGPSKVAPYGIYVEFGTGRFADPARTAFGMPALGRQTPWVYPVEIQGETKFFTTTGMTAKPYLRPAFDENKDRAVKELKKSLNRIIRKHVKG